MARHTPEMIELDPREIEALIERAEQQAFQPEDYRTIRVLVESYASLTGLLHDKNTSLARLRKMLFGASTEKTAAVVGQVTGQVGNAALGAASITGEQPSPFPTVSAIAAVEAALQSAPKKKGHGRKRWEDYAAAEKIPVSHPWYPAGSDCPECLEGTLYRLPSRVLVRIKGQAPLASRLYELEKLRCNLCGKVFTADLPAEAGPEKYDVTAASMIGLLKYGGGFPFHRLENLQEQLETPLPAATQWDVVEAASEDLLPAYEELIRQAAQGEVLQNDDTTIKILELMGKKAKEQAFAEVGRVRSIAAEGGDEDPQRRGLFTSGVVSTSAGRRIALFFSGRRHAGENLKEVLLKRQRELAPPIQMCDALSRNLPGELATIVANCLAHARRNFVEVHDRFPDQCQYVLETFQAVYKHDAEARQLGLSAPERLILHQTRSGPVLDRLKVWLKKQFDDRLVEPNSVLGGAISYLLKHWEKLTLFLRQSGAPLDNNLCERALKKAILHRKNAYFYKTQNGARVGDLYMSLIYTCELCGANPFDYLTELQRHAAAVAKCPAHWMPWNYRDALAAKPAAA